MMKIDLDLKGLNAQIDRAQLRVRQDVIEALMSAFAAVIEATPEDTGFLRASWHVAIDGRRSSDPPLPDYALKREHDEQRPFRSLPAGVSKSAGGRDVYLGDRVAAEMTPLPKPDSAFSDRYNDIPGQFRLIRRRSLKEPFARQFTFRNSAPYVDQVQQSMPLAETSAILARNAIITRLRRTSRGQR